MSNVEFEEENAAKYAAYQASQMPGGSNSTGGLAGWLIKKEIVKSDASAKITLIIILVVNIIITYVILKTFVL